MSSSQFPGRDNSHAHQVTVYWNLEGQKVYILGYCRLQYLDSSELCSHTPKSQFSFLIYFRNLALEAHRPAEHQRFLPEIGNKDHRRTLNRREYFFYPPAISAEQYPFVQHNWVRPLS